MGSAVCQYALAALLAVSAPSLALASGPHSGCCELCGKKVCHLTVERVTEEQTCFEVECEDICIPPVRFPWECGPPKHCGAVRTVNKLKTETYEVDVCEYNWDVVIVCCSCRDGCGEPRHPLRGGADVIDCDLLPYSDLHGVPPIEATAGRGKPLETPGGDLIYGPPRSAPAPPGASVMRPSQRSR